MRERPLSFQITALVLTLVLFHSITSEGITQFNFGVYLAYWALLGAGAMSVVVPRPIGQVFLALAVFLTLFVEVSHYWVLGASIGTYLTPFAVLSGIFVLADDQLQKIFYVPKMRWWETSQRYFLKATAKASWMGFTDEIKIKNISTTGCLAHASAPVDVNVPVQIKFNEHLTLNAIVVRIEENDIGLQFNFKNRYEQKSLRDFIRETVAAQAT